MQMTTNEKKPGRYIFYAMLQFSRSSTDVSLKDQSQRTLIRAILTYRRTLKKIIHDMSSAYDGKVDGDKFETQQLHL